MFFVGLSHEHRGVAIRRILTFKMQGMCEAVSKRSRPKPETKYMLTFVTVWWCPVPSHCGGSSVSTTSGSTAGTEFLLSHVGQSAIVPHYKGHPENDALFKSMSKEDGKLESCFRAQKLLH